jgi:putative heme-binding domain-containing protein
MNDRPDPPPQPRHVWPWFVLAGVVSAVVLAFFWVGAEVRNVRNIGRFDFRAPKAEPANSTLPHGTTNALVMKFHEALAGGDASAGRSIFFNKPEASCGKCHRVGDQGGDNGPALDGIGSRATREFILESVVAPNATITKGYESVILRLKNGSGLSGVLRQETADTLVVHTPDAGLITVARTNVLERVTGASPMPSDFPTLISMAGLRDLITYLTSLTTNAGPARRAE